jgi:calcium-dependent protein kinase
LLESTDIN